MITLEKYKEALEVVKTYEKQQLEESIRPKFILIKQDIPNDYWYSLQKNKMFEVKQCSNSDLREVEGFSLYEAKECYKVVNNEYAGNIILKSHTSNI